MQIRLTTTLFFGAAALIAGGCAPFTDGTSGGSNTGCVAAVTEDDAGAQVAINKPGVPLAAGTGTTTQLAEAFLVTSTQSIPEVQLKLDVVTPAQTTINTQITVQIEPDTVTSTAGPASGPTTPLGTAAVSAGITASGTLNAQLVSSTNPTFYDFCFQGAIGVNCPTPGIGATSSGVTLNAGQFYWVVVTTVAPGTTTSFVEWRAAKTTIPDFIGEVFLNGVSWVPINGVGTTNANFDFKLGC